MGILKERLKMRFKRGDKVVLAKDVMFGDGNQINKGTEVEIISRDVLLRSYDIDHNGVCYMDFNDTDFE